MALAERDLKQVHSMESPQSPPLNGQVLSVVENQILLARDGRVEYPLFRQPESVTDAHARLVQNIFSNSYQQPIREIIYTEDPREKNTPAGDKFSYYNSSPPYNGEALVRRDKGGAFSQVVRVRGEGNHWTVNEKARIFENSEYPRWFKDNNGLLHVQMVRVLNQLSEQSATPQKTRIETVVYQCPNGFQDLEDENLQPTLRLDQTKDPTFGQMENGAWLCLLRPTAAQLREREEDQRA